MIKKVQSSGRVKSEPEQSPTGLGAEVTAEPKQSQNRPLQSLFRKTAERPAEPDTEGKQRVSGKLLSYPGPTRGGPHTTEGREGAP